MSHDGASPADESAFVATFNVALPLSPNTSAARWLTSDALTFELSFVVGAGAAALTGADRIAVSPAVATLGVEAPLDVEMVAGAGAITGAGG